MKKNKEIRVKSFSSENELSARREILDLFKNCPIPDDEILVNLNLFIRRQEWSRALFMCDLYRKILDIQGTVVEFGVRWGRNLALFDVLRGIYEPFNNNRRIVGFDTFSGFASLDEKDGKDDIIANGSYSVSEGYEKYLEKIMDYHEKESPIAHIKKYRIIKGDVTVEIEKYLKDNPETIIAMAYFDLDIYNPTKKCLEAIRGHLTKGSVLGFDELNTHAFPGETLALKEVFGLNKFKIMRSPYTSAQSYVVVE